MSNLKWSALVYARTYEVDFRFITIPKDFQKEDENWALSYILPTTRSADKLRSNPRWSLFRNQKYYVIGVTCMVKDLIGDSEESSSTTEDMTKDSKGRPLYVFVGYVTKVNIREKLPPIPIYSGNNLEFFKPLYQDVCERWNVKSYEAFSKESISKEYQELTYSETTSNIDNNELAQNFNKDGNQRYISLWQDTEELRKQLWNIAVNCNASTSLGLASVNDIVDSPFSNATAKDISQYLCQEKGKKENEWDGVEEALSLDKEKQSSLQPKSTKNRHSQQSSSTNSKQEQNPNNTQNTQQRNQQHPRRGGKRQSSEYEANNSRIANETQYRDPIDSIGIDIGKVIGKVQQDIKATRDFFTQDVRDVFRPTDSYESQNQSNKQKPVNEEFGFKSKQEKPEQKSQEENQNEQSNSPKKEDSDWF